MQARDEPQQRALAAARGADDREELAFADREVHAVERVRVLAARRRYVLATPARSTYTRPSAGGVAGDAPGCAWS